jgi:type I restriction enzyme S subunit
MATIKISQYATLDSERRCDAEHITAPIYVNKNYYYGAEVSAFTQYGTSKQLNEHQKGFPVLRLNEFEQMFIKTPEKHCNLITESVFQQLRLSAGDVLVCRTNGNPHLVGKAAVVMEDTDCAYASYVFKIRPNNQTTPQLLTVYLNSKYGRSEIERHQMISIQTNFSPERFKKCRIPRFSQPFQTAVSDIVNKAYVSLKSSKSLYIATEHSLLNSLGFNDFVPSDSKFSIKKLSESFRMSNRIDAEYYQQKYDDIFLRLKNLPFDKLGKIVAIKKSIEPGSDFYGEKGVPFVRVSDLTKYGISYPDIKVPAHLTELRPTKDTILLTKDGSVGIAYKVEEDLDYITSGALLHLTVKQKRVLPDYLTLVLNSIIVQSQAERDAGGSIIQHWKPSEIGDVIIPILDDDTQKKITTDVQSSFSLRRQSEQLLNFAKQAVEMAIEEGEDIAMKWLGVFTKGKSGGPKA